MTRPSAERSRSGTAEHWRYRAAQTVRRRQPVRSRPRHRRHRRHAGGNARRHRTQVRRLGDARADGRHQNAREELRANLFVGAYFAPKTKETVALGSPHRRPQPPQDRPKWRNVQGSRRRPGNWPADTGSSTGISLSRRSCRRGIRCRARKSALGADQATGTGVLRNAVVTR